MSLGTTPFPSGTPSAPEVPLNTRFDIIEAALAGVDTKNLGDTTSNYTMLPDEARKLGHWFTNAGAAIQIIFPVAKTATLLIIKNASGYALTIKTDGAGATVLVPTGFTQTVWINGTALESAGPPVDFTGALYTVSKNILTAGMGTNTIPLSTTQYLGFGVYGASSGTEVNLYQISMPYAGTLKNFKVCIFSAQPASGSLVITIRKNAADTTVVVTIPLSSAAGFYSDTTHSVAVLADDKISIKLVNNATAASAQITMFSIEYDSAI
jgi:hypothetical protein